LLESVTYVGMILLSLFVVLTALRFILFPKCNRKHVTWGCGYTLPNTRMQYTGSSFSQPMTMVFRDLLRYVRRRTLPKGPFPANGKLETHCVDTVEYSVFNFLRSGDQLVAKVLHWIPETSRASIGFGLVVLVIILVIVSIK